MEILVLPLSQILLKKHNSKKKILHIFHNGILG